MARGIRDGALRGRFRDPVSKPGGSDRALALVQEWTATAGLTLHPTKTRIVNATTDGFDFLGYRFERGQTIPTNEEHAEAQRHDPRQDEADIGGEPSGDHRTSNRRCEAGLNTSNTAIGRRFPRWTAGYGCGCEAYSENVWASREAAGERSSALAECILCQAGLYSLKAAHAMACQSSPR